MGKIRLLPDDVASQVAAGEVVERPASLVKELVENSLDAGAGRIWIDFAKGGSRLVSVQDDGCGMDREDALLCLERHATSKIRTGSDLAGVRTMGFRGEALPSIASVSRFRLVTREPTTETATEVLVNGGRVESVQEVGAPIGTQIEVRDLFFNLPARRKFLRGEDTEAAHILHGLEAVALANPAVAFECRQDGRPVRTWPQAKNLAVRIHDIFGPDFLRRLKEIEPVVSDEFQLSGFLARPGQGRRDRLQQFVFLNGRPIVSPVVQRALREAYAGALSPGEHPLAVLVIEMEPHRFDCNVHPAKREVRLHKPEALRRTLYDAALAHLSPARPAPVQPRALSSVYPSPAAFAVSPPQPEFSVELERPPDVPAQPETVETVPYRILGSIGADYLALEGPEGLVLLDQRAAAERILFEKLLRGIDASEALSQQLLLPALCEFPAREFAWAKDHLDDLRAVGFSLEPFGTNTLRVDGLPVGLEDGDAGQLLHEILDSIRGAGKVPAGRGFRLIVAKSVAHTASRRRDPLRAEQAGQLLRSLLRCDLPYASPDGRPTMIQFSFGELDRKFGRP